MKKDALTPIAVAFVERCEYAKDGGAKRQRVRTLRPAHPFRSRSDVGLRVGAGAHLCADHFRAAQSRSGGAHRRLHRHPGRRARSKRGHRGHQLEHYRPPHRHDDSGLDLAPLRPVSVSGDLVGAEGECESRGHPGHAAADDRDSLGAPQQCQHHVACRAGDASHHRRARRSAVSISVRRNLRLQYRRHRYADRRSAQHSDRFVGRSRFQRLS